MDGQMETLRAQTTNTVYHFKKNYRDNSILNFIVLLRAGKANASKALYEMS